MADLKFEDFQLLDDRDPLAHTRDRFDLPLDTLYFTGNSLGAMPKTIPDRLQKFVTYEWGQGLIRSWLQNDWYQMPQVVGDKLANLIGANQGEVIICDTTSINLHKLVVTALNLRPGRNKIITTSDNFPTDLYILQGLAETLDRNIDLIVADPDEFLDSMDKNTALLALAHVSYKTGSLYDMREVTRRAHEKGALMLWDLSHSCGAMPLHLDACEVDLAIGCSYKYLHGGPGAPAFLFVKEYLQEQIKQPLTGWMGHADPFAMSMQYVPAPGIRRMLCGTHPVMGMVCLEEALNVFAGVDMQDVLEKSRKMGDLFIRLMKEQCSHHGFTLVSPAANAQRGSQVCFKHEQAYPIMQALIERNVIGDFRSPDIVRFGLATLYLRYVDIWDAVTTISQVMEEQTWKQDKFNQLAAVT